MSKNEKFIGYIKSELREIRSMQKTISNKREVMHSLIKTPMHTLYIIKRRKTVLDKCSKCNESRQISFFSPSGKELFEPCECSKEITIRKVNKLSFKGVFWEGNIPIIWFTNSDRKDRCIPYQDIKLHTQTTDYSTMSPEEVFFVDEKDCEKWCVMLNAGKL